MNHTRLFLLSLFVWSALFASNAVAQIAEARGSGEVVYRGFGLNAAKKREALDLAKRNALAGYGGTLPAAKRREFLQVEQEILDNLDRYVLSTTVLDEENDRTSNRFTITVRVQFQAGLIDELLAQRSSALQVSEDEKSYLTFVFVARKVAARTTFDQRRTVRAEGEYRIEETGHATLESGSATAGEETREMASLTTGGSTLSQADQLRYDVSSAMEINSSMLDVFSTAGFAVVEAEFLEEETAGKLSVTRFREEFSMGEDLSPKTLRTAATGCKEVDVTFLAVGTMDVGMPETDPTSGLIKIFVSVNAKVVDVSGRFPKTVASIGPVQFAGAGPDAQVAERNALSLAGRTASEGLVAQMRARDLF